MCGFAGFLETVSGDLTSRRDTLEKMSRTMVDRGPDGEGSWLSADGTVGLCHRRLAVLGLGHQGAQPMKSKTGRYILVFNGEIYNYLELKKDLASRGAIVNGNSDTAVLLEMCEMWGVSKTLEKLTGMFAFALWDKCDNCLTLARDRFGEKPLYYGWQANTLLFGSTLKPLREHPRWIGGVDNASLSAYVNNNYVPAPQSIYHGISKLKPGTQLRISLGRGRWKEEHKTYWSAEEIARYAKSQPFPGSLEDAVSALEHHLEKVLCGQMLSDVPLGALLSGGVDSTTVVALLQKLSTRKVKTFTIGFEIAGYDETTYAENIARYLGTDHTTHRLMESDILSVISDMPGAYDEPFADASQIPTYIVSKIASRDVSVVLSGDGGDEIFGGYRRYVMGPKLWNYMRFVPRSWRSRFAQVLVANPFNILNGAIGCAGLSQEAPVWRNRIQKIIQLLPAKNELDLYNRLTTFWEDENPVLDAGKSMDEKDDAVFCMNQRLNFAESMMLRDTQRYLTDDILVKVDRASMSHSLEARAPFLNHDLYQFAWSLPPEYRIGHGLSKRVLRHVLYRHVPRELVDRPKSGFEIPIGEYLRGPLRDWAENLLEPNKLKNEGHFDAGVIGAVWKEHCEGKRDRQYDLWSILMFQEWLQSQKKRYRKGV